MARQRHDPQRTDAENINLRVAGLRKDAEGINTAIAATTAKLTVLRDGGDYEARALAQQTLEGLRKEAADISAQLKRAERQRDEAGRWAWQRAEREASAARERSDAAALARASAFLSGRLAGFDPAPAAAVVADAVRAGVSRVALQEALREGGYRAFKAYDANGRITSRSAIGWAPKADVERAGWSNAGAPVVPDAL